MNIFELYLNKIKSILIDLNKQGKLLIPETFNSINAEIPPVQFDCDISTNVAMVLSKLNKKSPIDLAEQISTFIKDSDPLIENIAASSKPIVSFSEKIQFSEREIKLFLRTKMYQNKAVLRKNQKGKVIVKKLFNIIKLNPRKFIAKDHLTKDKYRAISDFISGMTDRYAINLYNNFK